MAQPDVMKLLEKEQGKAPRLSTQEIVQESVPKVDVIARRKKLKRKKIRLMELRFLFPSVFVILCVRV